MRVSGSPPERLWHLRPRAVLFLLLLSCSPLGYCAVAAFDPPLRSDRRRYKKKVEKDEEYVRQIKNLGDMVEQSIMQNYAIDIYQVLFSAVRVSADAVWHDAVQLSPAGVQFFPLLLNAHSTPIHPPPPPKTTTPISLSLCWNCTYQVVLSVSLGRRSTFLANTQIILVSRHPRRRSLSSSALAAVFYVLHA